MARQEVTLIVRIQDEYHAQAYAYTAQAQIIAVNINTHQPDAWHEVYQALRRFRGVIALQCPEHWFAQETLTVPTTLPVATPLQQDDWVQQQLLTLHGASQAPFYWDYALSESGQWQLYYLSQTRLAAWLAGCQPRHFFLAAIMPIADTCPAGWSHHWPSKVSHVEL